jgi:hypothetical protein
MGIPTVGLLPPDFGLSSSSVGGILELSVTSFEILHELGCAALFNTLRPQHSPQRVCALQVTKGTKYNSVCSYMFFWSHLEPNAVHRIYPNETNL